MRTRLYLRPEDHGMPLSLEDFEHANAQEGFWYELIEGRLYVSPIPNLPHEDLRKWLERLLDAYADERPDVINWVKAPARVFVPGGAEVTAPEPDIAAYQGYPVDLPGELRRWQDVSPLVVAEVISEDTADKDLVRNRRLYLRIPSIREYWIVDPRESWRQPSLTVLRRVQSRWGRPISITGGGIYTTQLLPGFTLALTTNL